MDFCTGGGADAVVFAVGIVLTVSNPSCDKTVVVREIEDGNDLDDDDDELLFKKPRLNPNDADFALDFDFVVDDEGHILLRDEGMMM